MHALRLFFQLLTPRERRRLYGLFAAVVVMALLEVVSVASIMPFLSVAADPARIHDTPYLRWAYETFSFGDANAFLIALGLAALGAMLLSNTVIVGTTWALYHEPLVLVLDEATSALDRATEAQVMKALHKRDAHRLIVCIAHRIHTLKHADHIIQVEAGRVGAQGSYDALQSSTGAFASASP